MPEHSHLGKSWADFRAMARPRTDWSRVGVILCLDPGETTGWAVFANGELEEAGQEVTGKDPSLMAELIGRIAHDYANTLDWPSGLERIVYEMYLIRATKAQQHVGSEVVTIQHIGAIKVMAQQLGIALTGQQAGMAKCFATDSKLRRWGLFQTNQRHANDAIRHGVYWLIFQAARAYPGD